MAKVSVVMPAYNAQDTLRASMQSALAQTHRALELIVIDDCSTDRTWQIVEEVAATDPRVVPLRQVANEGVAAARNAGIAAASGDYIAFLDSDDQWYRGKLALQVAQLQRSGARICYGSYRRIDEHGRGLSVVRPPEKVSYADMLKSNHIGNLTGLYDRSLGDFRFLRIGHEDYAFWLQLVRTAGEAVRLEDPSAVADYLVRAGSLSAHKARAARWQWRIYRDVERLALPSAAWYFMHYAINAALKRH